MRQFSAAVRFVLKVIVCLKFVLILASLCASCAGEMLGQAVPVADAAQTNGAQTNTAQTNGAQTPAVPPSQPQTLPNAPSAVRTATAAKDDKCEYPPCYPPTNWYARFVNGPQVTPLTVKEKGWLATRNFLDPFNAITVLAEAGIAVGADSHSAYGPGMAGFGRYVGVSFTQDLTGEFFNTFLIPSITHQDPHYHRMPHATYPRRILHTIAQVAWTQGDNGKGMLNYGNLAGFAIDDEISNLYVPGRRTNAGATAERYGIALATAPIGNVITEFLPDVARHIHVQVVVVQRVINQIAKTDQ